MIDVEYQDERKFVARDYLDKAGYRLSDYSLRTIRQRLRKLFMEEKVQLDDWLQEKATGMIKPPGYKKGDIYKLFSKPTGKPSRELLKERAKIRTEFAMLNSADRSNLPVLGGFKFSEMNWTSPTVDVMDVKKRPPIMDGNNVKEEKLLPGYQSFPERAMQRYGQERGLYLSLNRLRIPAVDRQATPVVMKKVPNKELPVKEADRSRPDEPTTLVAAV